MKLILDKRFKAKLKGRIEKYIFEVGILNDGPHYKAKTGVHGLKGQEILKTYAGGPAREQTRTPSGLTISDVSKQNRERMGFNYLTEPFKHKSSDIIKFTKEFFKYAFGRSQAKRLENLLQAIVRNPILRGEYGTNSALTQKIKGFNRHMIDTSQMFKAIKAKVKKRV